MLFVLSYIRMCCTYVHRWVHLNVRHYNSCVKLINTTLANGPTVFVSVVKHDTLPRYAYVDIA